MAVLPVASTLSSAARAAVAASVAVVAVEARAKAVEAALPLLTSKSSGTFC